MVAGELSGWMRGEVLPFWGSVGVDPVSGLFYEAMTPGGVPLLGAPKRLCVQCLLLRRALRYQDPQTGLLVDEGLGDGGASKPTRRSWLQTELVKAHLAEFEAGQNFTPEAALRALADLDRHHHCMPFPEGWGDQLDAGRKAIASSVPASIRYHVFVAVAEAEWVLERRSFRYFYGG